jgi:predicted TIM-barrel fold metal-dependent hydrolase
MYSPGEKLIIVSSDSHAGMPKEKWPEYLPERFHDLLPTLHRDNEIYPEAIALLQAKFGLQGHPEHQEAHTTGWHGLHDPVLRMADMDREGVAAELVYLGDSRLGDLFNNVTCREFALDAWDAGARAWNRWIADSFGFATDRFLITGAIGPMTDIDAAVAEIHWIADHNFVGTFGPGYMTHDGLAPLYDAYWEPFWTACEERGIAIVVHAGFGTPQGKVFPVLEGMHNAVSEAAGSTEWDAMFAHADAIPMESVLFFNDFLNHSVDARRPMWQLMLGGVFDRHPNLKFVPTEIRMDWIPATLKHLDRIYEEHRADLPAKRKPSEYYASNVLVGASFIHKAEVDMRHEIGLHTIAFGRDYPHPESTWPHTREWLRDAFDGVPDDELRMMLGENAIRFFDLDRERLAEIARRIGPTIDEIHSGGAVGEDLIESFAARGGYLKPAEGEEKLPMLDDLLQKDLVGLAGSGS